MLFWPILTAPPKLKEDQVHAWAVPLDGASAAWPELSAILSLDERHRAERFRLDDARRRFVTARAALRIILGPYLSKAATDIVFDYDARGKPRLAPDRAAADVRFNLAHAGDLALVAVAMGCDVGVDVERLRIVHRLEQIATRYFHPAEVAELLAAPADRRSSAFLRCWTGKEAVLKAAGLGVSTALDRFRVPLDDHDGAWISDSGFRIADSRPQQSATRNPQSAIPPCWLVPLSPAGDYIGALACVGEQRRITCGSLRL